MLIKTFFLNGILVLFKSLNHIKTARNYLGHNCPEKGNRKKENQNQNQNLKPGTRQIRVRNEEIITTRSKSIQSLSISIQIHTT